MRETGQGKEKKKKEIKRSKDTRYEAPNGCLRDSGVVMERDNGVFMERYLEHAHQEVHNVVISQELLANFDSKQCE